MTDGEDLTKWQRKSVGLTTSAELVNLERDIPYAIRVAARTKPTNEGLGRLSQKIIVEVKPRNVVLNLRAKGMFKFKFFKDFLDMGFKNMLFIPLNENIFD